MPNWKKIIVSGSDAVLNTVTATSFTGSLQGTASWANNALNSNTASYVLNAVSASRAVSAQSSNYSVSASGLATNWVGAGLDQNFYAVYTDAAIAGDTRYNSAYITSSFTYNPVSQLLNATASRAVTASFAISASRSTSASFATTASYALNTVSASYILNAESASYALYAANITAPRIGTNNDYYPTFVVATGTITSLVATESISYNRTTNTLTVTASQAATASFVNPLRQNVQVTGSLNVSGSVIIAGSSSAAVLMESIRFSPLSGSGPYVLYQVPTASYNTIIFEYSAQSGSWLRMGTVPILQSGSSVSYTETGTRELGTSIGIDISGTVSSGNLRVMLATGTSGISIKALVRSM